MKTICDALLERIDELDKQIEDESMDFEVWSKIFERKKEAQYIFAITLIDQIRKESDVLIGYDEDQAIRPVDTVNTFRRHGPTCRICGEAGHRWQNCGADEYR